MSANLIQLSVSHGNILLRMFFWASAFFLVLKRLQENTGKNINILFSTIEDCLHETNADRHGPEAIQQSQKATNRKQMNNKCNGAHMAQWYSKKPGSILLMISALILNYSIVNTWAKQ